MTLPSQLRRQFVTRCLALFASSCAFAASTAHAAPSQCLRTVAASLESPEEIALAQEQHYLREAQEAQLATWLRIDRWFGRDLGMSLDEGNEELRLASFEEMQAKIEKERARGRFKYAPVGLWKNEGGAPVTTDAFARHWARGELAHAAMGEGNALLREWSAFLLPPTTFQASTERMAFLQGILDDPALAANESLVAWARQERDQFARQVQEGLQALSQDIVMLKTKETSDPMPLLDRLLWMQAHLRSIAGDMPLEELPRVAQGKAAASGETEAQARRIRDLARKLPKGLDLGRDGQGRMVNYVLEIGLAGITRYPESLVRYLTQEFDPARHPPAFRNLRPGDPIMIKVPGMPVDGTFEGIRGDQLLIQRQGPVADKYPLALVKAVWLDDTASNRRGAIPGAHRLWIAGSPKPFSEGAPVSIGTPFGYFRLQRATRIRTPRGALKNLPPQAPVWTIAFEPVKRFVPLLDPKDASHAAVKQGRAASIEGRDQRWVTIEGVTLDHEGSRQFIEYKDPWGHLRLARITTVLESNGVFAVQVRQANGLLTYLSSAEIRSIRRSAEAERAFLERATPARRAVIDRFKNSGPEGFPDRAPRPRHGSAARRALFAEVVTLKERIDFSDRLPSEAPYPGRYKRRYSIEEYIEMPVDRKRIESLTPGQSYLWVLLSDGSLRICPDAGVGDAHIALAEGGNALSAGTLMIDAEGRLQVTAGDAAAYVTGTESLDQLEARQGAVAFAFETLTGTPPASVRPPNVRELQY